MIPGDWVLTFAPYTVGLREVVANDTWFLRITGSALVGQYPEAVRIDTSSVECVLISADQADACFAYVALTGHNKDKWFAFAKSLCDGVLQDE